jgi:hypothetical protein
VSRTTAVVRQSAPSLVGLAALGFAQPLLELLGDNPEFFIANHLDRVPIVATAVLLLLVPPAVALATELVAGAFSDRAAQLVHSAWITVFGTLLGSRLLGRSDQANDVVVVVGALALGVGLAVGERRLDALRTGLRYLGLAPLVFLAAFLFASDTGRLARAGEVAPETHEAAEPAPVVVLMLDELPLASLLRPDGTIDESRYPNFARLADQSTWFRNALSNFYLTERSVPSALDGDLPREDALPIAADHPRNLFTTLGGTYELDIHEVVTRLCPTTLCPPTGATPGRDEIAADVGVIAGHVFLPPALRSDLPRIDTRWAGFGSGSGIDDPATATELANQNADRLGPEDQPTDLLAHIAGLPRPGTQELWYHHAFLPHSPWVLNPDLTVASPHDEPIYPGPPESGLWATDQDGVAVRDQALQRHLFQVGATDELLGRLIDQLEENGSWDEALVAVLADHGVAFTPGLPNRGPIQAGAIEDRGGNLDEIYRIPMFIKFPGQRDGETRDDLVLNADLFPTVLDALGIDADLDVDGQSLLDGPTDRTTFAAPLGQADGWYRDTEAIGPAFADSRAVAARNASVLSSGDGWQGVAALGPLGRWVGVDETAIPIADRDLEWSIDQQAELDDVDREAGGLPTVLQGTVQAGDGAALPDEAVVIVNGRGAGVARVLGDPGDARWVAVIDPAALRDGPNDVHVVVPTSDGP